MRQSARKNWTTSEIEIIVADYMDMLQIELAGGQFVKSKRNKALQNRIDRSHPSIEFKHCNISAVLASLGLPFIRGCKPRTHYQLDMFKIIEVHLIQQGLHETLTSTAATNINLHKDLIYVPPPKVAKKWKTDHLAICQRISKFDQAQRNTRMHDLGEAGEAFLLQSEKDRLLAHGRGDLVADVRWVSKEDGDGLGYDIFSFSKYGEERLLEVKTTNGPSNMPFYLSANERHISEKYQDKFRLVRLYNFSWSPTAYKLKPPLNEYVRLTPTQYRCEF